MSEPVITFDEDLHRYYLNGKWVPLSVTGVLGITGFYDLSMIPKDTLENKRRIGKHVHKATELLDTLGLDWDSVRPDSIGYIAAYRKLVADLRPEWKYREHRGVMNVGGMLCGFTDDCAGWIAGEPWIFELKTSAVEEDWWRYQTAGYELGLPRMAGQSRPYRRRAARLQADGTYRLTAEYTDLAHDRSVFRSALHLASVHMAEGRIEVQEERAA